MKENDNEQLLKELEDLNVSVHERKHIEQVNGKKFLKSYSLILKNLNLLNFVRLVQFSFLELSIIKFRYYDENLKLVSQQFTAFRFKFILLHCMYMYFVS
jgi:hypothetical protein